MYPKKVNLMREDMITDNSPTLSPTKISLFRKMYAKGIIQEIEEVTNPQDFHNFLSSYNALTKQLENVRDPLKTTPHKLLIDYLQYVIDKNQREAEQTALGV